MNHQERKQVFSIRKYKAYGTQSSVIGVLAASMLFMSHSVLADESATNVSSPEAIVTTVTSVESSASSSSTSSQIAVDSATSTISTSATARLTLN